MSAAPILERAVIRPPLCPVQLAQNRRIDPLLQEGNDVVEAFFPKQFPRGTELSLERLVDGHVFVVALPGLVRLLILLVAINQMLTVGNLCLRRAN